MNERMKAGLVCDALTMALFRRGMPCKSDSSLEKSEGAFVTVCQINLNHPKEEK